VTFRGSIYAHRKIRCHHNMFHRVTMLAFLSSSMLLRLRFAFSNICHWHLLFIWASMVRFVVFILLYRCSVYILSKLEQKKNPMFCEDENSCSRQNASDSQHFLPCGLPTHSLFIHGPFLLFGGIGIGLSLTNYSNPTSRKIQLRVGLGSD
jgi:hypothetical protein